MWSSTSGCEISAKDQHLDVERLDGAAARGVTDKHHAPNRESRLLKRIDAPTTADPS